MISKDGNIGVNFVTWNNWSYSLKTICSIWKCVHIWFLFYRVVLLEMWTWLILFFMYHEISWLKVCHWLANLIEWMIFWVNWNNVFVTLKLKTCNFGCYIYMTSQTQIIFFELVGKRIIAMYNMKRNVF